jgi:hypothetical protein
MHTHKSFSFIFRQIPKNVSNKVAYFNDIFILHEIQIYFCTTIHFEEIDNFRFEPHVKYGLFWSDKHQN